MPLLRAPARCSKFGATWDGAGAARLASVADRGASIGGLGSSGK
jgi:hypothetical protein